MAWDDDMPLVVRTLLQDTDANQVYTDDGLIQMILISGMQVLFKLRSSLPNSYEISIANETLKPDPTLSQTLDNAFMILTCYTAAVTLLKSEIRQMTRQGISIQDGDSKVSLQRDSAALGLMLKSYEDTLADLTYDFQTSGSVGFGEVVVSPYPYFSSFSNFSPGRRSGFEHPGGYIG